MILRGVDYGPICGASGVQGFMGEGYGWHQYGKLVGLDFTGMTFVAKTVTWHARKGNMDEKLIPSCIIAKPWHGVGLNSVGLTNRGAAFYFREYHNAWRDRTEPFMLSFMSVAATAYERLGEFRYFVQLFGTQLHLFKAPVALQINVSCPNTEHSMTSGETVREACQYLDVAAKLGIPILVKINVLLSPSEAKKIMQHDACDGLVVSNTLPWRALPNRVDWDRYFGPDQESPLKKRGFSDGGLSGAPLLPLVREWVLEARAQGIIGAINAGGGILRPRDAIQLLDAGADSVFIGSMAFLRPWNVARTIRTVHKYAQNKRQIIQLEARSAQ